MPKREVEFFVIDMLIDQIFEIVKVEIPCLEDELIQFIKKLPDLKIIDLVIGQAKNDMEQMHRIASRVYLEQLQSKLKK